jgi:hypothetical protein
MLARRNVAFLRNCLVFDLPFHHESGFRQKQFPTLPVTGEMPHKEKWHGKDHC